jgi:Acetyltransferases, including N-acetylases of ribosomal proteins
MSMGSFNIEHSSASDFPFSTPRLRFVPKSADLADAEVKGNVHLSDHLSVLLLESWPPALVTPPLAEHAEGWKHSYLLHPGPSGSRETLVGLAGHKRWPADHKTLQIGAVLVSEYHGQHLGEEAVAALGTWGLTQPGIDRVICDVPEDHKASAKSLVRAGFSQAPEAPAPGFLRFELRAR